MDSLGDFEQSSFQTYFHLENFKTHTPTHKHTKKLAMISLQEMAGFKNLICLLFGYCSAKWTTDFTNVRHLAKDEWETSSFFITQFSYPSWGFDPRSLGAVGYEADAITIRPRRPTQEPRNKFFIEMQNETETFQQIFWNA